MTSLTWSSTSVSIEEGFQSVYQRTRHECDISSVDTGYSLDTEEIQQRVRSATVVR